MSISRRQLLQTAGLSGVGITALRAETSETDLLKPIQRQRVRFDPNNIRESTMAFLKLTGSQGTEVVRKWFTGKIYAYFPGEPVKELFYVDGFYLSQYEALENGTHRATRYEVTIKRDLNTGNLLETWDNPFTGRKDTVVNSVGGPQVKLYNDWGFDQPSRARGADNPLHMPWMIFEDEAWVTWDSFLRFRHPLQPDKFPLESSGKMLDLVNLTNYKGKLSDIEDPNMLNAPGVMIWNAISGWQPWMRMGQKPGTLIYKAIGVKLNSFADMPEQIFNATEKAFPGHLSEQRPWQEGNYQWFDRNNTKPEQWSQPEPEIG